MEILKIENNTYIPIDNIIKTEEVNGKKEIKKMENHKKNNRLLDLSGNNPPNTAIYTNNGYMIVSYHNENYIKKKGTNVLSRIYIVAS
jgi:hypothetical protein